MATNSELKSFEYSKAPSTAKRKAQLEVADQPDLSKLVSSKPEADTSQTKDNPDTEGKSSETPKYKPEELAAIFDELLFQGEYSETVKLKGKLVVTFRTRTSEESDEIAIALDTLGANLFTTLDQKRALLSLQYSLVRYHNKDLSGLSKEDKAKFIGKIASPVIVALINELSKFDQKVFEALKEGEESF